MDPKDLCAKLADELWRVAPPKIEGGSPARQQWIADIMAVMMALYGALDVEAAVAFKEAMDERS